MDPGIFGLLEMRINQSLDPIWPEQCSRAWLEKQLAVLKEYTFARGFHCLPVSDEEAIFKKHWFRFYRSEDLPSAQDPPKKMEYYIGLDLAYTESSSADDTAIVVVGVHDRDIYVLEAHTEKTTSLSRIEEKLRQYIERYSPRRIGVETVGAQAMLYRQLKRRLGVSVRPCTASSSKGKKPRMILLADYFEDGHMFLRGNGSGPHKSQEPLYRHLLQFTGSDKQHDDLPDALDFAVEVMPSSGTARTQFIGRRDT
jgi:predicted phage terminase large subunit-like protein